MAMMLEPCPFCGNRDVEIHHGASNITFLLCGDDVGRGGCGAVVSFRPNLKGSAAVHYYNRRAHLSQPAQAVDAEMVYLRRRGLATEDCIPVMPGTASRHVDETLITRIVPLRALAGEKAEGWRPIETAPKDGTAILLHVKYSEVPVVGYWHGDIYGYWDADTDNYTADTEHVSSNFLQPHVTHWMPLPTPPTSPEG